MAAPRSGRWRLVRARPSAVAVGGGEGLAASSIRRAYQGARRPRRGAWLVGSVVVAMIGSLAWVVVGTSVLGVRRIEVTGSRTLAAEEVRAVAAVAEGTPLARVDTAAVATRVAGLPPVARARVSRSWPSTLVISVTERTPVAVASVEGGFAVLDAEGVIFDTLPARPDGLVLVRVPSPAPADPATRAALTVVMALPDALRAQVVAVVADLPTRIRLEVTGGRVVVWGDAERNDTKAQVAAVLLARPAKTIDVSAPDVATTTG